MPLEKENSINMFWFDATEQNGIIYLFGKVWNPPTKSHLSTCVTVKNIERNLFVLARKFKHDGKKNSRNPLFKKKKSI